MRTTPLIALALAALLARPGAANEAPAAAAAAPADTSCRTCHQAVRPTHGQAELVPCPREKTAGPRKLTEGPKVIAMNTNGAHYGRVTFAHQAHAAMAEMGGGCSACHHEATEGEPIRACVDCHPAGRQRVEIDRPDRRAAIHRQCLDCHRSWDNEALCGSCHGPAVGPAPKAQPRIAAPRQLVYETVATNGALATFFHSDHVQTFKQACADCHRNAACADCHDRTRRGQPADRRIRVAEDPETDHARCTACHAEDACARCHAATPLPAFDHARHGIRLDDDHADAACAECHLKGNYRAKPDCASCHDDKAYPRDLPGETHPGSRARRARGWPVIRRKIGRKLTTTVVITTLLIIGVFASVSMRSYRHSLLDEVERHAVQISQTVKSSTEYDMLLNEPDRIHEAVRRLGNQEGIERIRIMNKAGEVTYSSDAAEIGKTVDESAESCVNCHFSDPPLKRLEMKERTRVFQRPQDAFRTLGVITPIYNQESCWTASCHEHPQSQTVLGVFDVVMPLAAVDAELRRSRIQIAVFALSAVLSLSLILGIFVRHWVDVPVKQLVAATQRVADGDLSQPIDEARTDELGQLATSFNHMTRKLSEARTQLVQSDKLASLGRLAAGVAHEINNPLTGVLTFSSLLLKRTADRPEVQEDLKVIVRETIRCRGIVKSLLDFARQTVPRKSESDLNEIIRRSVTVVERQLTLNHVAVVQELADGLPRPIVDANQMEQVLVNLLVNAADAIGSAGGTITVRSAALSLSPLGTTQIKHALCPKRHNLMDNEVRFAGHPAIRLRARSGGQEGVFHLDPVYGKGGQRRGFQWAAGQPVQVLCPECAASLLVEGRTCPRCQAPLFAFEVPSAGAVETCTRPGCGWQRWEELDASGDRPFVEIQVQDTGCGMTPDQLGRIYEPFYSTKGARGTGLGLAVIWGILDSHNGTIDVRSEVGRGTTFTVRIPVKP